MHQMYANRVVMITGAASGVGRALAMQLAEQGARLVLADSNPLNVRRMMRELGWHLGERAANFLVVMADPTDGEQMELALAYARHVMGRVDTLINAGAPVAWDEIDADDESWPGRLTIQANVA